MTKGKEKIGSLIKRKKLLTELKNQNIKRINKQAVKEIEKFIGDQIGIIIKVAREILTIKGKKTLEKEEIIEAVKKLKEKNEERYEV